MILLDAAREYHDGPLAIVDCQEMSEADYASRTPTREVVLRHLKWMVVKVIRGEVEGERASRWLGYVQGELRAMGKYSVREMVW